MRGGACAGVGASPGTEAETETETHGEGGSERERKIGTGTGTHSRTRARARCERSRRQRIRGPLTARVNEAEREMTERRDGAVRMLHNFFLRRPLLFFPFSFLFSLLLIKFVDMMCIVCRVARRGMISGVKA